MTTLAQHREQAATNLALYGLLVRQNSHLDWALTILFYTALHYVDAYLLPVDPPAHRERNSLIMDSPSLRPIWRSYRYLFEMSCDARYECFDPTPDQLRYFRHRHFDPLQSHMLSLLAAKGEP